MASSPQDLFSCSIVAGINVFIYPYAYPYPNFTLKKQNKLHSLRPPSILGSDVVLCCCGPVLKFSLWSRDPGVCLFGMPGSVAEERYQSSL
jgi:hypothetical protein